MATSPDALVGRTIAGKFVIEARIGSGAMGAVYRARQIALEKTVAIKVLHGEHLGDPQFVSRFHREAKAASRLNHPNSMQVIDFGEDPDGLLYIAMEYLDGRSLHRVLRDDRPLPATRIADILMQTLAALAVAHDMGVVHRDLKPENIIVLSGTDDDGRVRDIVKVCDFGIAKISDARAYRSGSGGDRESGAPLTTAGLIVGTPEYMSPEQGRGEKLDPRSDLYAVGVILFEMLAGRVPFEAENALGVLLRHVSEAPPRPSEVAGEVHAGLEAVCLRALLKARDGRYPNAREMRASIRAAIEGSPPVSVESGPDGESVRVITATPAPATAATVRIEAPPGLAVAAAESEDPKAKPTLVATTAAIGGTPRKRATALVVAVAVLAAVVGIGGGLLVFRARSRAPATAMGASASAPLTTLSAEPVAMQGDIPELDQTKGGAPTAGSTHATVGHRHGSAGPSSSSSSPAKAPEVAASASAQPPPAPPAASSAPAAAASTAAPAPPASSAPGSAPPSDPAFDPERGYVEVGLITAQGVRDRAVRSALHGVGLAACYRGALRTRGARVEGVATLSLSYDEKGATRGAIVTGADFLPGLARCLQGAATGASVPDSQVDSGGGTADVTLAFKVP
jgi:serine/threonine-protein kinase